MDRLWLVQEGGRRGVGVVRRSIIDWSVLHAASRPKDAPQSSAYAARWIAFCESV
jgi:hypothetical protein